MPGFKFPFSLANKRVHHGGWSREVTARELPIAKELVGVNMRLEAGGIRELHWHKAAEWSIMLYGTPRITGLDAQGRSFVDDVGLGDDDGHFPEYETVLLSQVMAHTPRDVMARNFGIDAQRLAGVPD